MKARSILAVVLALSAMGFGPARADHAACTIGDASGEHPMLADPSNDWEGALTGNGNGAFGDVYREGIDITSAWLSVEGTKTFANIMVNDLAGIEMNTWYLMQWNYNDVRYYVAALPTRPGSSGQLNVTYEYGTIETSATSSNTYTTRGSSTGSFDVEADLVRVEVKLNRMGSPPPGAVLADLYSRVFFQVGVTLQTVDDTDFDPCVEAYVP